MRFNRARKAERFKFNRSPQDASAFVEACGYEGTPAKAALALTIRQVIAECGAIEPRYISVEARWPEDLGSLDFWDSIDFLHFVFSVERAAGMKLRRDEDLALYFSSGFTVAGLVRQVVSHMEAGRNA